MAHAGRVARVSGAAHFGRHRLRLHGAGERHHGAHPVLHVRRRRVVHPHADVRGHHYGLVPGDQGQQAGAATGSKTRCPRLSAFFPLDVESCNENLMQTGQHMVGGSRGSLEHGSGQRDSQALQIRSTGQLVFSSISSPNLAPDLLNFDRSRTLSHLLISLHIRPSLSYSFQQILRLAFAPGRQPVLLRPAAHRPVSLRPGARALRDAAGGRARPRGYCRRGREPGQPDRRGGARGRAQGQRARV